MLDFASVKELTAQTGHEASDWPLVILKELVDNDLDATEEAGIAPIITVTVEKNAVTIRDNGPGIPATTIERLLDFTVRVSSREAYVSPTRGAQGNALKTILAMPFVLDQEKGEVEIAAHGERHRIVFKVDRIRQEPVVEHQVVRDTVKTGTEVRVLWPDSACSILRDAKARFLQIADDYTWLNPNLTLTVDWFGTRKIEIAATTAEWPKWRPSDPTSAHWYDEERLKRLVGAYVSHDADNGRKRTVREFVGEFRGLSATAKQKAVLEAVGLARAPLSSLVADGQIEPKVSRKLLKAMQKHSSPVQPTNLGVIGREHFEARFAAAGCEMQSFDYRKILEFDDQAIPFVIETAFGWRGDKAKDERRLITGINWSPGILNPFRNLGGFGLSLDTILSRAKVDADEPVIFVLHAAYPRVEYLDRGKSAVVVRS
jgi:DNA topoisomerase VI subunit B